MPIYDYKCPKCSNTFSRFLSLAQYSTPQQCFCGAEAVRMIVAPAVRGDYAGYECPVTGKWIEGRKAHKENLARHGCRVLEPGETQALTRRRKAEDEAFAEKIADSAAEIVANMPSAKREQLGREIESGLDIAVERRAG